MLTATQKLSNVVLMLVGLPSRPTKISAVDAFVPSNQNFWILLALNCVTKMNERSVLSAVPTVGTSFVCLALVPRLEPARRPEWPPQDSNLRP